MRKWLIADWQQFWRWYSTWMHVIGTTIAGVLLLEPAMPPELQAAVPLKWRVLAIGVWALLGFVARVVKQ